jgi:hypothetical protein
LDRTGGGYYSECKRLKPRQHQAFMAGLLLKRASASRPSGEWNDDDYDVLADGEVVG